MKAILSIAFVLSIIATFAQSPDDSYTRYELLDPATQKFRILYDVTATEAGAAYYYNTLRKGSEHQVDGVLDLMTGQPLGWKVVSGAEARKAGFAIAQTDTDYLQVKLARPVAQGNEYRLRIDKTYQDPRTYFIRDGVIVFDRLLTIARNAVVLPRGYEVTKCNYPVQVILEQDGRIKLSFLNMGNAGVPLHIEARKLGANANLAVIPAKASPMTLGQGRDKSKARIDFSFPERANQTREIVYFLQQPETHSFRLYHDYTEVREGIDRYLNVVRPGSKASNPSAMILDTGTPLKVETLKGAAITERGLDIGEPVTPESEVVAIWFDKVKAGQSVRLRIEETYTDPNRYILYNDEFIFDRSFGRPFNTVVLPAGWFLTANAVPATIDVTPEGNISLYYVNSAPEDIDVLIRGRKR